MKSVEKYIIGSVIALGIGFSILGLVFRENDTVKTPTSVETSMSSTTPVPIQAPKFFKPEGSTVEGVDVEESVRPVVTKVNPENTTEAIGGNTPKAAPSTKSNPPRPPVHS